MMPHMDGLETMQRIRKQSMVPIIVLTALGEEEDVVRAYEKGADDYLRKPFGVGELLARVRAVLRRAQWIAPVSPTPQLVCGELVANLEAYQITLRGQTLELTPTEFNLLVFFMQNRDKVLPHRTILQNVWGPEYGDEPEYLRVYIGRLRQKIETDPGDPRYLVTARGIGYVFARP